MGKETTSLNFGTILLLIFITLKLTNFINWSWWWVLSPLWITPVIFIVAGFLLLMYTYIFRK